MARIGWTMVVLLAITASDVRAQERTKVPAVSDPRFLEASLRQQWAAIGEDLSLRKIDEAALGEARAWREGDGAPAPTSTQDGQVVFSFGSVLPRIVCAPQDICDIALQEGETVNDVKQGDQRFILEPALSGNTVHVIVRPLVGGIKTTVAVYTDRRVYHLEVQSSKGGESMPRVSFSYPEDKKLTWLATMAQRTASSGHSVPAVSSSSELEIAANPGSLHFGYEVETEGRWWVRRRIDWAPLRVYDDGQKTIIEMPRAILARELPILLVRDGDGKDKIVNFRVKGQHFVVDRIFDRAALVKGVGRRQERVSIVREEE